MSSSVLAVQAVSLHVWGVWWHLAELHVPGGAMGVWQEGSSLPCLLRKGKVCCCSRAVSLQETGSGCRRAPMGCGALSPRFSEWPLSLGGGRVLAAAGSCVAHCSWPCLPRLLHCLSLPSMEPAPRVRARSGAGCEQSCVLPPVQHHCSPWSSSALAALSSRVVEHGQATVMLVRRIAKPPAGFAVAKFRLGQFCPGAAEPCCPAGGWEPCACHRASLARLTTSANSHSLWDRAPRPIPGVQPCFDHAA